MSDERLDQLERRVMALEALVRQLAGVPAAQSPPPPAVRPSVDAPIPPPPPVRPPRSQPPNVQVPERPPVIPGLRPAAAATAAPRLDSETWLGQRGLLGVGVLSLLLAAGYFLKLAIDRGWISPVARCATGVVVGFAVAALGWKLAGRARRYGTSLIGAGAGVMYLAIWAACRLYDLVPPTSGIGALALISVSLAAIAIALDAEALALVAAIGAFAAPLLLGRSDGQADLLLVYTWTMVVGLGAAAAMRVWRRTTALLVIGAFLITVPIASVATPLLLLAYATTIGVLATWLALKHQWPETRFIAFTAGWAIIFATTNHLAAPWPALVAGLLFAAPIAWLGFQQHQSWMAVLFPGTSLGIIPRELLYFCVLPFPLLRVITLQAPVYFASHAGYEPLILAGPYLIAGLQRPRPIFAGVGTALLLAGLYQAVPGIGAVGALLAIAIVWLLIDRVQSRTDAARLALASWSIALVRLIDGLDARPHDESAFVGPWALAMFATVIAGGIVATLWRRAEHSARTGAPEPAIWGTVGVLLLGGVTQEIDRAWQQSAAAPATAQLASGLSVSAWWLAAAAALIIGGFRREQKALRLSGLTVAVIAILKVLVVDLDQLDALYRVASVAILAVVTLSLAWVYNRRARPEERGAGASAEVDDPVTEG